MNRLVWIAAALVGLGVSTAAAQPLGGDPPRPTAEELIKSYDDNMTFTTRSTEATLMVYRGEEPSTRKLEVKSRGWDTSYVVFTAPERDKGTRYLKRDGSLIVNDPTSGKVIKMPSHSMRQGVMDSDVSFEDLMESPRLEDRYEVVFVGEEKIGGHDCWVLELTAKEAKEAYGLRWLWIDKQYRVPVKEDRYTRTRIPLKTVLFGEFKSYENRHYPTRIETTDLVAKKGKTVLVLDKVEFDAEISDSVFSRSNIMRPL